jgi:uncharacterized membrane protein YiaA
MKNFPEEFIKQKDIKNRYKAILCSTYNQTENTLFTTFRVKICFCFFLQNVNLYGLFNLAILFQKGFQFGQNFEMCMFGR